MGGGGAHGAPAAGQPMEVRPSWHRPLTLLAAARACRTRLACTRHSCCPCCLGTPPWQA
jgi:hypothetical protein